jgi:hypothetical protein
MPTVKAAIADPFGYTLTYSVLGPSLQSLDDPNGFSTLITMEEFDAIRTAMDNAKDG